MDGLGKLPQEPSALEELRNMQWCSQMWGHEENRIKRVRKYDVQHISVYMLVAFFIALNSSKL